MKPFKKYVIPALCIFNVVIHLSAIFFMEFHRDELLYFSLSNHLDLGYPSVPPMISWLAWVAKTLFGFSPFAVKVFPAILSGFFVYLTSLIAKELGGKFYAQVLTAIALMCTPLALRAFILFQPVPFDIFFWTLTLYLILKYVNHKQDRSLLLLGLTLGLALLNKYLILFLLIGIVPTIAISRHREVFTKRSFYLALGITILIVSPNVVWQVINDFPVLTHMAQLEERQLQNVSKIEFLSGQALMFLGSIIVAIVGLIYLLWQEKYRFFAISSIVVLLILMFMNAKAYYAAGLYPFLIAAGGVAIENQAKNLILRSAIVIGIVLIILPVSPLGIPFMQPERMAKYLDRLETWGIPTNRIHEDREKHPLPQDYADMLGWYDIAESARLAYDKVENKETIAIYGENYGIAGAVSLINASHGMPEVLSFSDAFGYWIPEKFEPDVEALIYINDEMGNRVKALFDDIQVIGRVDDPLSRQLGVTTYLCQKPNRSFNEFWQETLVLVRAD